MKTRLVLLALLNLCSCKKQLVDPEFHNFSATVTVDNKGPNPVNLTLVAKGGDENNCKPSDDRLDIVVPPGTKDSYAITKRCWFPLTSTYASFSIQKTLSDKAKEMKIAYKDLSNLKDKLTAGLDVAWRIKTVVTKGKISADPWIANQGYVDPSDIPISLTRPDMEAIQSSPVRFFGKNIAVFVDVPDIDTSVDIGLPVQLFQNGVVAADDGYVYSSAAVRPIAGYDGLVDGIVAHPIQIVCDGDLCTVSAMN